MQCTFERCFERCPGYDGPQIDEGAGRVGRANSIDADDVLRHEIARSVQQWRFAHGVRWTHRHLRSRGGHVDELVQVGRAAVRRHSASRQARSREFNARARRCPTNEKDSCADFDEALGQDDARELSSRQPDLHELRPCDEARLFCSASCNAPFDRDVHAYHQSGYQ